MAAARRNPLGFPLTSMGAGPVQVVRLGTGEHSHLLNPKTKRPLCESGRGRAKAEQKLYKSDATVITCYRCSKLAQMNVDAGRAPWEGP